MVSFAPIIGDYGVSFIVCIAATAVIKMFSYRKKERFISISLLIIIFLASLILNEVNWTKNTGKILNVALVQGAIPQEIKWSPEQVGKSFNIYTDLSESFWSSDLIIWQETAIASKFHLANNFIEKTVTPEESVKKNLGCLLYTSPSPRDGLLSRMQESA